MKSFLGNDAETESNTVVLTCRVRKQGSDMTNFLQYTRPGHVLFDMKTTTKEEALQEMLDALVGTGDVAPQIAEGILKNILKREDLASTGIGRRFAFPYIQSREIEKVFLLIGRSANGIDWDALDGELVNFTVLVITPLDQGDRTNENLSLNILHAIKKVRDDHVMRVFLVCQTPEKFWELLEELDENLFD